MTHRLALCPGEPAGIGPDLCLALCQKPPPDTELVIVGDPKLFAERAQQLNLAVDLQPFNPLAEKIPTAAGCLRVMPVELVAPVIAGELNVKNVRYVLTCLREATDGTVAGCFDALVTGPIHKGVINEAGVAFSGHTEFLAARCKRDLTVMMLATEGLRVALATTHLPLTAVPGAITKQSLERVIRILEEDLRQKFGISEPRILVCGLNPHAGEGGHLGREEIEVIEPVITQLQKEGLRLIGPLPADTLFTPRHLDNADAVLSMFHDQGLPVLKYKGFGAAVNVTLGLPIVRTSVDHGTALDLAGTGKADLGSLIYAVETACLMATYTQAANLKPEIH